VSHTSSWLAGWLAVARVSWQAHGCPDHTWYLSHLAFGVLAALFARWQLGPRPASSSWRSPKLVSIDRPRLKHWYVTVVRRRMQVAACRA
jgi:hypothetical protein